MKNLKSFVIIILVFLTVYLASFFSMPQSITNKTVLDNNFNVSYAFEHIKFIGKEPHYIGTDYHKEVKNYLVNQLEQLNLDVYIQDTMVLSNWNTLSKVHNVVAKIKGQQSSKALLFLTHYDSAPHSYSYGTSDDANGLAVILESLRVYLEKNPQPKNDIIILFSDAEELGLNGAWAFAKYHPWAKDVGVVVNLEARGTSGPSMMLAETNGGNNELIHLFKKTKAPFPVSNSILYSIYKMLPNDTDMTAFREGANIPGYTFAYIDNHYDYHTVQDNIENFDLNSMAHQANYVLPIINHFANADLSNMNGLHDLVFFNVPKKLFSYPFTYNHWIWGIALMLFLVLLFFLSKNKLITTRDVFGGFVPFLILLIFGTGFFYFLWKLIIYAYPDYQDMLHGFTYNGYQYMLMFYFFAIALSFFVYQLFCKTKKTISFMIAPLVIWFVVQLLLNLYLPGAGFLIIPLIFSLISLALLLLDIKVWWIHFIVLIPVIIIMFPLIESFPVGLGLKTLFLSQFLLFLSFGLMYGLFGFFKNKKQIAGFFLMLGLVFLATSHKDAGFKENRGKPNSLLYLVDANTNKAYWTTYNKVLDNWISNYISINDTNIASLNDFGTTSKYNSGYTFAKETTLKNINHPSIDILKDTLIDEYRHFELVINPNRTVNRLDVLVSKNLNVYDLLANGCKTINKDQSLVEKRGQTLLSYYPTDSTLLNLSFKISKNDELKFEVQTSSFDLLNNPMFSIPKRPKNQIPMPFVLTDAILVKKQFKL